MATRKMALEAYMAHIREKRFTDYLAEMMAGPENIEVIEIETEDAIARAWQQVGEDLRLAMGVIDGEIAEEYHPRQKAS